MRKAIVLALLASFLAGCSSPSPSSHKFPLARINIGTDPNTLDPRKAHDLYSMTLARMLFEGLTRVGKADKAELALASNVSFSEDMKKYTIDLKDAQWSNGDPVTAHDFVYAWKKTLDPIFPSDVAFHLYVIKNAKAVKEGKLEIDALGVRALDEKTLEIELEYSAPYFLELLAVPAFFPVNQRIDRSSPQWANQPESFVCNGPFLLKEWKHNDHILMEKNATYWDASTVELLQLDLVMISGDTELKLFEKGEIDWAGSPLSTLPVEALQTLKSKQSLKIKEWLGTYFIRVNTVFPFDNPLLRKAFAMAINRQDIIEHVTQGNQIPATGLVPLSLGLRKEPYFHDGAIEEARAAFNDALDSLHLDKKNFPEVTLIYAASERNHSIAQALQQQWSLALGIRIKLESIERQVYFDRLSRQDYQLASSNWLADFNDPINFLDVFRYKKGSSNNTHWENQDYADLLHRSETAANPDERMDLLRQSERLLMEEMPILPIFHFTMLYLQQPYLQDVFLSSMGIFDFKWAKISSETSEIAEGAVQ